MKGLKPVINAKIAVPGLKVHESAETFLKSIRFEREPLDNKWHTTKVSTTKWWLDRDGDHVAKGYVAATIPQPLAVFDRYLIHETLTAVASEKMQLDFINFGHKLCMADQEERDRRRNQIFIKTGKEQDEKSMKQIDVFYSICKNAFYAVEIFGWGILASSNIIKNNKGSIWTRFTTPARKEAKEILNKLSDNVICPMRVYNSAMKVYADTYFASKSCMILHEVA
ncbi:hypothetical protein HKX48_008267 [Thoreauomyces humboldtii]|nr:hypothetical protein HKX48_008267 [Thoreauomyces humboldtii]